MSPAPAITPALQIILVSLLWPRVLLSSPQPFFFPALASELRIRCQVTQCCCHLQRPFWSLKAAALKYFLLDVVSHFWLPNSLALTHKLYVASCKHGASQQHTGWFREMTGYILNQIQSAPTLPQHLPITFRNHCAFQTSQFALCFETILINFTAGILCTSHPEEHSAQRFYYLLPQLKVINIWFNTVK